MNAHIYLVTNLINGKLYVGQTTEEKCKRGHGVILKEAYKKYGTKSFNYEQICSGIDNKKTLDVIEKFWIKTMDSLVPSGYNIELGGNVNALSEESKAKISRSLMGNIPWNKGKPMTADVKARLSVALKGRKGWNKGIPMSESTKAKLCAALKGRKVWNTGVPATDEMKAIFSAAKKGKPSPRKGVVLSVETIAKMKANHPRTPISEAGKAAIRAANLGKVHAKVTCPHCGVHGGVTSMFRWHFDNCRKKEHCHGSNA